MKKGQNTNHPAKGSVTTVEPIRKLKDIKSIKRLLADKPRDLCLFVMGINTNLRAGDLLQITTGMVRDVEPGGKITIREGKTGKLREITFNNSVVGAVQRLLNSRPYQDTDYLFSGQRKHGKPLTVSSVNRLVKSWCREINLRKNYGSHTLRKTFGYMQRTVCKTELPVLMELFNHSSQKETLRYIGIEDREKVDAYMNLEL